ncbi:uncharacterized protein LOC142342848 [Convolutriloba macropyga]|uniref:uncharacterized protein LOC142342848 n=1 Tax=Convolutriloba macropyga TaxID=536237 RepID=UPI003F5201E1
MSPRDLYAAVAYHNAAAVEKILRHLRAKGSNGLKSRKLYYRDENGLTALHKAALTSQFDVLTLLLTFNLDCNLSDITGHTPLHYAAYSGLDASIYQLASYGANVNAQDEEGQTALHIAARDGHGLVCIALLKCGAQLLVVDKFGKTAIETAAEFGKEQVLKICLQNPDSKSVINGNISQRFPEDQITRSGSISSTVSEDNFTNLSPLQLAVINGHVDCIRLLIQFGCNVNQVYSTGTVLHDAALSGKLKIVQFLVQNGADVFKTNKNGETALDKLNKYVSQAGCADVKQYLHECMTSLKARVIKKYDTIPNSSHLLLNIGDIVTVTEQNGSNLWKGFVNNRSGYFPKECVELLPRTLGYPKRSPPKPELTRRQSLERYSNSQASPNANYIRVDVSSFDEQKRVSSDWVSEQFSGAMISVKQPQNVPNNLDFERFKMPLKPLAQKLPNQLNVNLPTIEQNEISHYDKASGSCEILSEEANKILYSLSHHSAFSKVNEIQALEQIFPDPDLQRFAKMFIESGYDSYTAVRMSSADLAAVGVTNPDQRKRLVDYFNNNQILIRSPKLFKEIPDSVPEFLEGIHLSEYTNLFMKSEFNTLCELTKATMEDLMEMGIDKLGHQKRILIYLKMITSSIKKESDFESDIMSMDTERFLDAITPTDNPYCSIDLDSPASDHYETPMIDTSDPQNVPKSDETKQNDGKPNRSRVEIEEDSGNFTMDEELSNSPDTLNGSTETLTSIDQAQAIHSTQPNHQSLSSSPNIQSQKPNQKISNPYISTHVQDSESMRNSPDIFQKISVYPGHSLKRGPKPPPPTAGVHLSIDPVTLQPYLVPSSPGSRNSRRGVSPNNVNSEVDNNSFVRRPEAFVPPTLPQLSNNLNSPMTFTAARPNNDYQSSQSDKPAPLLSANGQFTPTSIAESMKGLTFIRTESVVSLESEDPYVQIPPPPPLRLKTSPSDSSNLFNIGNTKDLTQFTVSLSEQKQE